VQNGGGLGWGSKWLEIKGAPEFQERLFDWRKVLENEKLLEAHGLKKA